MRKVYTCVDIGSHSIKIVVAEEIENNFVVLSRTIVRSKGVKKGIILDEEGLSSSLDVAFKKIEDELGIDIDNVLCIIPSDNREFSMTTGRINIKEETIGKESLTKVLQDAVLGKIEDGRSLVSISPITYTVDDKENLKDVKGMSGNELTVRAVLLSVPKINIRSIYNVFKKLNKNIVDVEFGIVGDYHSIKDSNMDNSASAVVNIGYDKIDVGIFNKGIMIKEETIDTGSRYIDKDISYIYNIERRKARYLKETFAISNTRYADVNDVTVITNKYGENVVINQLEISEVVESRLRELLKLAKKQISILTNKEIRYIIITGGISELAGFEYLIENIFGYNASVLSCKEMGVRSNSYSSSFGAIKSFSRKLEKRDKIYSMISENSLDIMTKKYKKATSESGLGGILNYFTGNNKED